MPDRIHPMLTRRTVCAGLAVAAIAAPIARARAIEMPEKTRAAILELFGDRPLEEARVTITMPPIAENGFSVPVAVDVDSPMSEADHVRRIALVAERNPIATLFQCHLGPRAGRASVATRVRLAGTQTIRAIAETNDGRLWVAGTEVVVTLAACVVL